jgi:hypothetical protein
MSSSTDSKGIERRKKKAHKPSGVTTETISAWRTSALLGMARYDSRNVEMWGQVGNPLEQFRKGKARRRIFNE